MTPIEKLIAESADTRLAKVCEVLLSGLECFWGSSDPSAYHIVDSCISRAQTVAEEEKA